MYRTIIKLSNKEKDLLKTIENKRMQQTVRAVYRLMIRNINKQGICDLSYRNMTTELRRFKLLPSVMKVRIETLERLGLIEVIKINISDTRFKYNYKVIRLPEE